MSKPRRPRKKPYTAPRLRCYGDLKSLTQGGIKQKDESNVLAAPKTRPTTA